MSTTSQPPTRPRPSRFSEFLADCTYYQSPQLSSEASEAIHRSAWFSIKAPKLAMRGKTLRARPPPPPPPPPAPLMPSDTLPPSLFVDAALVLSDVRGDNTAAMRAIRVLANALGLPMHYAGQNGGILQFHQEPLRSGLRVTQGTDDSVWLHSSTPPRTTSHFVRDEDDLRALARHLLEARVRLESNTGNLKPIPRSNAALLAILLDGGRRYGRVLQFAEARRAVDQGRLVDAAVELLTPFRVQPSLSKGEEEVVVDLLPQTVVSKYHESVDIVIEELQRYLLPDIVCGGDSESEDSDSTDSTYGSQERPANRGANTATMVIVSKFQSTSANQIDEDRKRYPRHMLRGTGWILDPAARDDLRQGLVYDLSNHVDIVAFVTRVLAGRAEVCNERITPFETRCKERGWDQRDEVLQHKYQHPSAKEKLRMACRERRTRLSTEATIEDLLEAEEGRERAEKLRQLDEETAAIDAQIEKEKREVEEMRSDWVERVSVELERTEGIRNAPATSGKGMSWADEVEELGEP
ncbi:hypothetical protein K458DRAFT_402001 [Lentithecium fluviatile CBS 122367]|uniref:Uncharacterized protein n=1 Tax=Lentithecium fluviatile CBS 122367 TaxID=1168545 RepID=A0A6G1JAA9_9PLEO|nr:hypothetical protein K458DRAFT_402001 [Lentithecium fluviatile CBS 122367]